MAEPFDSSADLGSRLLRSLTESVSVPGKAAVAVVNPDGTDIGAGGGGANVNIHDSAGNNINNGQQTMANSVPVVIASDQTAIPVSISGSATSLTPSSNQVNIAVTGTAVPLSPVPFQLDSIHIIANITNGNNIFLGDSTVTSATGLILEPGRGVTLENIDVNTVFINGTAPDGVSAFGLT